MLWCATAAAFPGTRAECDCLARRRTRPDFFGTTPGYHSWTYREREDRIVAGDCGSARGRDRELRLGGAVSRIRDWDRETVCRRAQAHTASHVRYRCSHRGNHRWRICPPGAPGVGRNQAARTRADCGWGDGTLLTRIAAGTFSGAAAVGRLAGAVAGACARPWVGVFAPYLVAARPAGGGTDTSE